MLNKRFYAESVLGEQAWIHDTSLTRRQGARAGRPRARRLRLVLGRLMAAAPQPRSAARAGFRRVLLKLSGEALMGPAEFGLDAPTVDTLARELVEVQATGRRARARDRRRQHLPRHEGDGRRHGPGDGRLHGHARDRLQLARRAGGARAERRRHARALGARRARGGRAVHPPARDPPSREGPGRHLRRRHRQPVLHDRHGRGAARARDRRGGDPDGEERRSRRLRRRPARQTRTRRSCRSSRTCRRSSKG